MEAPRAMIFSLKNLQVEYQSFDQLSASQETANVWKYIRLPIWRGSRRDQENIDRLAQPIFLAQHDELSRTKPTRLLLLRRTGTENNRLCAEFRGELDG